MVVVVQQSCQLAAHFLQEESAHDTSEAKEGTTDDFGGGASVCCWVVARGRGCRARWRSGDSTVAVAVWGNWAGWGAWGGDGSGEATVHWDRDRAGWGDGTNWARRRWGTVGRRGGCGGSLNSGRWAAIGWWCGSGTRCRADWGRLDWGRLSWLAAAWADGQGGGRGNSVGLAAVGQGGGLWAVGLRKPVSVD